MQQMSSKLLIVDLVVKKKKKIAKEESEDSQQMSPRVSIYPDRLRPVYVYVLGGQQIKNEWATILDSLSSPRQNSPLEDKSEERQSGKTYQGSALQCVLAFQ